jgi:hypothetical protein
MLLKRVLVAQQALHQPFFFGEMGTRVEDQLHIVPHSSGFSARKLQRGGDRFKPITAFRRKGFCSGTVSGCERSRGA